MFTFSNIYFFKLYSTVGWLVGIAGGFGDFGVFW